MRPNRQSDHTSPLRKRGIAIAIACVLLVVISARGQQSPYEPERFSPVAAIPAKPIPTANQAGESTTIPAFPFRQASGEEPVLTARPEPLKLAPRGGSSRPSLEKQVATSSQSAIGSVVGSLAVVLGLFLLIVWCSRRFAPAGAALLPKEVVELLGRAPLTGRQNMQLVKVGNKLLLVALSPTGAETLTEITDPVEVEHLSALCRRGRADSASSSFTHVLGQLAAEPSVGRGRTRGAT